MKSNK